MDIGNYEELDDHDFALPDSGTISNHGAEHKSQANFIEHGESNILVSCCCI